MRALRLGRPLIAPLPPLPLHLVPVLPMLRPRLLLPILLLVALVMVTLVMVTLVMVTLPMATLLMVTMTSAQACWRVARRALQPPQPSIAVRSLLQPMGLPEVLCCSAYP